MNDHDIEMKMQDDYTHRKKLTAADYEGIINKQYKEIEVLSEQLDLYVMEISKLQEKENYLIARDARKQKKLEATTEYAHRLELSLLVLKND